MAKGEGMILHDKDSVLKKKNYAKTEKPSHRAMDDMSKKTNFNKLDDLDRKVDQKKKNLKLLEQEALKDGIVISPLSKARIVSKLPKVENTEYLRKLLKNHLKPNQSKPNDTKKVLSNFDDVMLTPQKNGEFQKEREDKDNQDNIDIEMTGVVDENDSKGKNNNNNDKQLKDIHPLVTLSALNNSNVGYREKRLRKDIIDRIKNL